jgi:hypothetical protein
MPYSADVPIMSNQNLTIDTGEGETASKAMRMKVNFHQRGKIIIWEHNGRKETLSNEVFVQLAKWYIGEVQSFEQNMNSLMGRYKQGNKIGNKTIELKNSWMGPEGLTELLHRNLRLNRNMFACSVNQCALRKYHMMFDEDGIFGSQGDAYQDRTWNYEEDILAQVSSHRDPSQLLWIYPGKHSYWTHSQIRLLQMANRNGHDFKREREQ